MRSSAERSMLACSAALLVPLFILAPSVASAQPIPLDASQARDAYDAAVRAEQQLQTSYRQSLAGLRRAETAALEAARRETALRRDQIAALREAEGTIVAQFERIERLSQPSQTLVRELDVLERWYAIFEPVVAHTDARSFRAAEQELEALARAGLIGPGTRRFRSFAELRSAVAAARQALGDERRRLAAARDEMRAALGPLRARRNTLMAQIARASPAQDAAFNGWTAAAAAVTAAGNRLFDAERQVVRAWLAMEQGAATQGPPVLLTVAARGNGAVLYDGRWQEAGFEGNDSGEARRARLRQTRQRIVEAYDALSDMRRAFNAERLKVAVTLDAQGRSFSRFSQLYRDDLWLQAWANVGTDIGLTIAELVLTGGAATLERKAEELAAEAGQRVITKRKVAQRMAESLKIAAAGPGIPGADGFDTASTLRVSLITHFRRAGDSFDDALARANAIGVAVLEGGVEARIEELVRSGVPRAAARDRAQRMVRIQVERLRSARELRQVADATERQAWLRARFGDLDIPLLGNALPDLSTLVDEADATYRVSGAAQVLGVAMESPDIVAVSDERSDTASDILVGEALEWAVGNSVDSFGAASTALGAVGSFRTKLGVSTALFMPTAWQNRSKIGVAAVSAGIKYYVAQATDVLVNKDLDTMATLSAQIAFGLGNYYRQTQLDQAASAHQEQLARALGAISEELRRPRAMTARTSTARIARDATVTVELVFSAPLLAAPTARLGSAGLTLQRSSADGLRWTATVPARLVGDGTHQLTVSAGAGETPHGSLDRDPATPAVRRAAPADWSGFERGSDTSHTITLKLADVSAPVPSVQPSLPPATTASLVFAVGIVDYRVGNPRSAVATPVAHGIGAPEGNGLSFGCGGSAVYQFGNVSLADGAGPDIKLYGLGPGGEAVLVELSADRRTWIAAGIVGEDGAVDIAPHVRSGTPLRFVRLTDRTSGCGSDTWPGADIDTVSARVAAPGATPPPVGGDQLRQRLESIIAGDARGWSSNRYEAGSIRNVRITEGSEASGNYSARGEYTFNNDKGGWVVVKLEGGRVKCLQYHDFSGTCRPPH
jgi:hypothetical protein